MTEKELEQVLVRFREVLRGIQAGRADTGLVENIKVELYGQMTPLIQIASITTPEPRLLQIQPWDPSSSPAIEKALSQSNLGLSVSSEKNIVRATLPELTSERREDLIKLVNQKKEEARIELRQAREVKIKDLKQQNLPEDDVEAAKKKVDEEIAHVNKELDEVTAEKIKALREV